MSSLQRKLLGIALLACASPVCAGLTIVPVVSGTQHKGFAAMAFDKQAGIAVGFGGEVQTTKDGGTTWTPQASASKLGLLGVDTRDGVTIAVGQMGLIVVKQGDSDWKKVDSDATERLLAVSLNSKGEAVAVGAFGAMSISADRGESWKAMTPDWAKLMPDRNEGFQPHLYAVRVDDAGTITAVGEFGSIIRSTNAGADWTLLHKGVADVEGTPQGRKGEATLFAIDIRDDGVAYAVGQEGLILRSGDHGQTWSEVDSGTHSLLFGVKSSSDGTVVATGMYSMLISRDDGTKWSSISNPYVKTSWYSAIDRPQGKPYFVAGKAGTIMRVTP